MDPTVSQACALLPVAPSRISIRSPRQPLPGFFSLSATISKSSQALSSKQTGWVILAPSVRALAVRRAARQAGVVAVMVVTAASVRAMPPAEGPTILLLDPPSPEARAVLAAADREDREAAWCN